MTRIVARACQPGADSTLTMVGTEDRTPSTPRKRIYDAEWLPAVLDRHSFQQYG